MNHRKGVEVAYQALAALDQLQLKRYPQTPDSEHADLHVFDRKGGLVGRVEVLTSHNNRDSWEAKWRAWSERTAGTSVWLFTDRSTMTPFWNYLQATDAEIILDGGEFGGNANNWSAVRVNDRLHRSRQGPARYQSLDACWTVAGMLEASRVDVLEWAKTIRTFSEIPQIAC